mmetsp:Transcript_3922/g.11403  ORF Transcript_3922/g.11403 Transcript_3922/m.11403 type:complete len:1171 (-) Transcript_3922:367-3879(-)
MLVGGVMMSSGSCQGWCITCGSRHYVTGRATGFRPVGPCSSHRRLQDQRSHASPVQHRAGMRAGCGRPRLACSALKKSVPLQGDGTAASPYHLPADKTKAEPESARENSSPPGQVRNAAAMGIESKTTTDESPPVVMKPPPRLPGAPETLSTAGRAASQEDDSAPKASARQPATMEGAIPPLRRPKAPPDAMIQQEVVTSQIPTFEAHQAVILGNLRAHQASEPSTKIQENSPTSLGPRPQPSTPPPLEAPKVPAVLASDYSLPGDVEKKTQLLSKRSLPLAADPNQEGSALLESPYYSATKATAPTQHAKATPPKQSTQAANPPPLPTLKPRPRKPQGEVPAPPELLIVAGNASDEQPEALWLEKIELEEGEHENVGGEDGGDSEATVDQRSHAPPATELKEMEPDGGSKDGGGLAAEEVDQRSDGPPDYRDQPHVYQDPRTQVPHSAGSPYYGAQWYPTQDTYYPAAADNGTYPGQESLTDLAENRHLQYLETVESILRLMIRSPPDKAVVEATVTHLLPEGAMLAFDVDVGGPLETLWTFAWKEEMIGLHEGMAIGDVVLARVCHVAPILPRAWLPNPDPRRGLFVDSMVVSASGDQPYMQPMQNSWLPPVSYQPSPMMPPGYPMPNSMLPFAPPMPTTMPQPGTLPQPTRPQDQSLEQPLSFQQPKQQQQAHAGASPPQQQSLQHQHSQQSPSAQQWPQGPPGDISRPLAPPQQQQPQQQSGQQSQPSAGQWSQEQTRQTDRQTPQPQAQPGAWPQQQRASDQGPLPEGYSPSQPGTPPHQPFSQPQQVYMWGSLPSQQQQPPQQHSLQQQGAASPDIQQQQEPQLSWQQQQQQAQLYESLAAGWTYSPEASRPAPQEVPPEQPQPPKPPPPPPREQGALEAQRPKSTSKQQGPQQKLVQQQAQVLPQPQQKNAPKPPKQVPKPSKQVPKPPKQQQLPPPPPPSAMATNIPQNPDPAPPRPEDSDDVYKSHWLEMLGTDATQAKGNVQQPVQVRPQPQQKKVSKPPKQQPPPPPPPSALATTTPQGDSTPPPLPESPDLNATSGKQEDSSIQDMPEAVQLAKLLQQNSSTKTFDVKIVELKDRRAVPESVQQSPEAQVRINHIGKLPHNSSKWEALLRCSFSITIESDMQNMCMYVGTNKPSQARKIVDALINKALPQLPVRKHSS